MALDFAALAVRLGANIQDLEGKLTQASGDLKKFTKENKDVISSLGVAFTAVGVAITGSFALMIKSVTSYNDEIYETSKRTGITTETLSKLKYVADQTESSFEAVAMSIKFLNRGIYEASQGNAKYLVDFGNLGIQIKDVNGKLITAEDAFMRISDKFKGMEDGAKKTSIAMSLFGRQGTAIIPILNLGSAEIKRLSDEAERLGVVLTTENAKDIDAFSDQMKSLKASMTGLYMSLAITLIPSLKKLVDVLTTGVVALRNFANAHPVLTQAIVILTGALGLLSLAIGSVLLLLGPFALAWNSLMTLGIIARIQAMVAGISAIGPAAIAAVGGLGPLAAVIAAIAVASYTVAGAVQAYIDLKKAQEGLKQSLAELDKTYSDFSRVVEYCRQGVEFLSEAEKEEINRLEQLINVYNAYLEQGGKDEAMKKRMQKEIFNQSKIIIGITTAHQAEYEAIKLSTQATEDYIKAKLEIQNKINTLTMDEVALKVYQHQQELELQRKTITDNTKLQEQEKRALLKQLDDYNTAYMTSLKAAGGALDAYNLKMESMGLSFLKLKGDAKDVFGDMPMILSDSVQSMQNTLSTFLFDFFTGNLDNAASYFQSFANSILQSFSNMIAQMVAQALWASTVSTILSFFSGMGGIATGSSTAIGTRTGGVGPGISGSFGGVPTWSPTSYASGTEYVPHTGLYKLHQGEEVKTADQAGETGINIINVIDEKMVPAILSRYPNAVVNIINENIIRQGSTRKVIKKET